MSYPARRYLGEKGEISAAFRSARTEPELISAPGQRIHYLATHASTQGDFGLYRVDMGPRAPGPSAHFHRTIRLTDRSAHRSGEQCDDIRGEAHR